MMNLVLTGFMGTGKTSIGERVAERLGRPFVDMDAVIASRAGKPIARIFEEDGEAAFRASEARLCRELAQQQGLVVATGGGTVVDSVNRAALSASGVVVCLTASVDEILARVGEGDERPLLRGSRPRAQVERLLEARQAAYAAIPWQVETTGRTRDEVVDDLVALTTTRTLPVTHSGGAYDIHVGMGILPYLGGALTAAGIAPGTRIAVVSNDVVAPLYAGQVRDVLVRSGFFPFLCVVPDGEAHKRLDTVHDLYHQLLAGDVDRSGVILALGGGVTGDMAGFAAATFMRGVRLVQVPTSLLAMTDASVGAKTGVDLPQGKNLVGAFKQPEMVFIDLDVLETLPPAEFRSGLAEVIKHGVIGDTDLFLTLSELGHNGTSGATSQLEMTPDILARSLAVKIDVVEEDPLERGRRAVLNLGHTAAHALEQLSDFQMRHGDAVAIGMVVAARVSEELGRAEAGLADRLATVLAGAGLPTRCPHWPVDDIWAAMRHDKKRQGRGLRWVLPRAIGDVEVVDGVPEALVRSVLVELGAEG